jgi:TRAP-type transport system periplasmic protein
MIKTLALVLLLGAPQLAQAQTTIKIATLAPEGSSWMRSFHEWQKKVEERTQGRVKIKFYAGGVQGDEKDVLRKIRLNQLQGAAITAIGLATIDPHVRALEMARSYEELDALRAALGDTLKKRFEEKGFVVGVWGDVGPVRVFSNKPIKSMEDLRSCRLWMWSQDPITKALFDALGLRGVPLDVPELITALATGQVDTFMASPLSAVALQWARHAKYVSSMVMGEATGATVIAKKAWDAIPDADRKILEEEARAIEDKVQKQIRQDNTVALDAMIKNGMQVIPTPPELEHELDKQSEAVARTAGKNFSKDFQEQVEKIVSEYRNKRHK